MVAHLARAVPLSSPRITLSGGLVSVQGEGEQVLQAADEQLYAAKHAGRGRICATVNAVPL